VEVQVKDILGRNVEEGDFIVKPTRRFSSAWLSVYRVETIYLKDPLSYSCTRILPEHSERRVSVSADNCLILPPNWIPEDLL
jgi:hypothetical protein